jgi:hypothetical protein
MDYHGGLHLRAPIPSRPSVVPYAAIGVGALRRAATTVNFSINDPVVPIRNLPLARNSQSELAVNFGGGLRFYHTENFGTRIEFKGYKPSGTLIAGTSDPFFKLTFGVFYYFK